MTEQQVQIIRLHKRRADRYTLAWIGFAVLLLTGFQFFLDRAGIDVAERTAVTLLLALIVRSGSLLASELLGFL